MRPPSPPPPQPPPPDQPPPQPPPPQEPRLVRKVIVEVVEARDLLPKDGQGSSSPYVIVDFDGQRKRTSTRYRELNPVWNEPLEFILAEPGAMDYEELDVEVYNDKRASSGAGRKNHFLGRVKIYGSQFARRGDEGLIYFPLEKKSVFSWVRGELGMRIYYYDDVFDEGCGGGPPPSQPPPPEMNDMPPEARREDMRVMEAPMPMPMQGPMPTEAALDAAGVDISPPMMMMEEMPPPQHMMPMPQHMMPMPPHPMMVTGTVQHHEHPGPPPPPHYYDQPGNVHQVREMHAHPPPEANMQQGPPSGPPPYLPPQECGMGMPPPGPPQGPASYGPPQGPPPPDMRRMPSGGRGERVRVLRRPDGEFSPRIINGKKNGGVEAGGERISSFDLVEPMTYLFIRIVKARGVSPSEAPFVKIRTSNHFVRSKPASFRPGEPPDSPDWNQVFALGYNKESPNAATLEISIWDAPTDRFLGGVCFDLSDVPVRDPPDSPLAPQWYRLEGGGPGPGPGGGQGPGPGPGGGGPGQGPGGGGPGQGPGGGGPGQGPGLGYGPDQDQNRVTGDIQLAVWIGTQADDAFPEAWCSDAPPSVSYTRSKVYQSPKLWYLRVTVLEAQDLQIPPNLPPLTMPEIRVKGKVAFQMARTRRGSMSSHGAAVHWNEDLIFVAGEPLEDQLVLLVEDLTGKEPMLLGHVVIPVAAIPQRLDERHLASKWLALEGNGGGPYCGRIQVRACLEGGYHVLDEAAHVCSDFRPTAKQLWKPPMGILELGILGARGLLPMKTKDVGKGSTDAYCVAKYGKKWVRTRTITDSFDPRWNEQYTWQVYDPCTVLTVGVFDNWRMLTEMGEDKPDFRIGKVRIRVSTLENNRVYTNSYPLMVLLRTGLKKMGEIELAVRFVCPSLLPDTCAVYGQPLLPKMHYIRPLGVAQQEALRVAATRMVAGWLARSEPPLGPEVVRYLLDADSHTWSMRKSKTNWFRIVAVLAWAIGLAKWLDDIKRWRNSVTTILVHVLYLVLIWYPDLIVPTACLYVFLIGVWHYRFKPKIPAGMDIRLSQAEIVDPDDLDEEFDTIPSSRQPELVRMRYDRLRILAARVQTVLGDVATQGERVQALVSWRDPRATKLFIGVCLIVTIVLYAVPAKMVAVALGFYYLRHPMFRDPMPPPTLNFFRRLPSLSDRIVSTSDEEDRDVEMPKGWTWGSWKNRATNLV
ncbi:hypothetical protein V2J09_014974 [Rumex salicifolius]